ncbi:PstS family phosphate ABC transporter substrate-binding protein [Sphingomonas cannabina]|uniref:PstS family phosphate ABC transporter substrate-binding protein n=1 Tax=Sphingomonas cannabina TaxID=2899123 RepID=UPI001F1ABB74|nr:PstS family phosphate ABC transporter substrate-binding protein [Sphingomonas cannabina]UIJ46953.1 PstS family phosphate ABC transporter substrate-binding protein [Sphingomonas cannabina]
MRMFGKLVAAALPMLALAGCGSQSRDQIKIVGSSTVYPFTTAVAEQFVNKHSNMKAPVVESTGTGAGVKLFCAGIGPQHPDILNASRQMKKSEYDTCQQNGVGEIMEIQIGTDGIALAESNNGPKFKLTRQDVYLALAANPKGEKNTARTWKDVNPALPAIPIQVYGPPSTSGTRDAFVELVMDPGCEAAMPAAKAMKAGNPDRFKDVCSKIRDDGPYVDKGENDNLIVQNLAANPNAVGIFGYSYLEENKDRLHGVPLEGIEPTYETIAMGRYPGARPLYLYVKKAHLKAVPGLKEFLDEYAEAWKPSGPLVKRGLIAATNTTRLRSQDILNNGIALNPATLH